jgi:hypothetical protein
MLKKQKSTWNIDDPTCPEKQDDATASVICVSVVIFIDICPNIRMAVL